MPILANEGGITCQIHTDLRKKPRRLVNSDSNFYAKYPPETWFRVGVVVCALGQGYFKLPDPNVPHSTLPSRP